MKHFLRVWVGVTGTLFVVLGIGGMLKLTGFAVAGEAIQVVVTVPWTLMEFVLPIPTWCVRSAGCVVTGALAGLNATVSRRG